MAEKKIFISYNRQNKDIIKTIADDIEALGYNVWFDQELTGGQAWWEQILAEVRDCDIFVFTLSQSALNSAACKLEYIYAGDLGKPILPLLVGEGVSTNLLPPELSQIQFIDYQKKDRDSAFHLARALNAIPPPKPLPDPLPAAPEVPISYLGKLSARLETESNLSYEEQSALLIDLKRNLRDQESAGDTKTLLKSFRNRRDLYASIAEEIDELINTLDKTQAVNNHTPSSPKKLSAIKIISPSSPKKLSAIKIISLSLLVAFGFLVGDLVTTATYILARNYLSQIIYEIIWPFVRGLPIGLCISLIVRKNIVYLPRTHFF